MGNRSDILQGTLDLMVRSPISCRSARGNSTKQP
jgi:hypothetical protein